MAIALLYARVICLEGEVAPDTRMRDKHIIGLLKGGDVVTQDNDFKFISVEDDDDEIVIQAGVSSSSAVVDAGDSEDAGFEPEYEAEDAEGQLAEDDGEDAAERAKFEREKARRLAMAEANRMVTTEEDLKASVPFAGMQRAIIIIAIVLIAVFIAYYKLGAM